MTDLAIIIALLVTNLLTLLSLFLLVKAHTKQVDRLTDKIMAPDLSTYAANRERTKVGPASSTGIKNNPMQSLEDADPEEVMAALARATGRGSEMGLGEE